MGNQTLNIGNTANDGSGDTLRVASGKINQNFDELYTKLGGSATTLSEGVSLTDTGVVFTYGNESITLTGIDAVGNYTLNLPAASGELLLTTGAQSLTDKTLVEPIIVTPSLKSDVAVGSYVFSLASLPSNRTVTFPLLTNSDTLVFQSHSATLSNKTLDLPILNSPVINDDILDANGAELIEFVSNTSAVNHLVVENGVTSVAPNISVEGTDTDIDLFLHAKGNGAVRIRNKIGYSVQNMTAGNGVDLTDPITLFNSSTALPVSMGDGTSAGEEKKLININNGEVQVTPNSLFGTDTTITLNKGHAVTLVWTGTAWVVLNNEGATVA